MNCPRPGGIRRCFFALVIAAIAPGVVHAQTPASQVGIVIMHGKGGSPTKYVSDLASSLKDEGYLVANLEMPWSGYYRKFGFANMPGLVLEGVPQEAFFALSIDGQPPQDSVAFHEGFKADKF